MRTEEEGGEGPGVRAGVKICSRLTLLCLSHSWLQTPHLCVSWGLPPSPSWHLRARATTACHPASPGLHKPPRPEPEPTLSHAVFHTHPPTVDWAAPSCPKAQHEARWGGETIPLFSPRLRATPLAGSPAPRRHGPGPAAPRAGGMLVGWMGHTAHRCLHNRRVTGSVGRAGPCSGDEMGRWGG